MNTAENAYAQYLHWTEQTVYNLEPTFANRATELEEHLSAFAIAHYLMDEPEKLAETFEHPLLVANPEVRFKVLTNLIEAGDTSALPMAHQAMIEAAGNEELHNKLNSLFGTDFGALESAKMLVRLATIGAAERIDGADELTNTARGAISRIKRGHQRVAQFTQLYRAGDDDSLHLACAAANEVYGQYEEGDPEASPADVINSLELLVDYTLEKGNFDHAALVTERLRESGDRFTMPKTLAKRLAAGDTSVEEEFKAELPVGGPVRWWCMAHLAKKAQYPPAIADIRVQAAHTEEQLLTKSFDSIEGQMYLSRLYEYLVILHDLGDQEATKKFMLYAQKDPRFHTAHGFDDGEESTLELAKLAYERSPNVLTRLQLLKLDFSEELFKEQLVEEVGRLQDSFFSWLGESIVLIAHKSKEQSDKATKVTKPKSSNISTE